jgi:hypothetical protein
MREFQPNLFYIFQSCILFDMDFWSWKMDKYTKDWQCSSSSPKLMFQTMSRSWQRLKTEERDRKRKAGTSLEKGLATSTGGARRPGLLRRRMEVAAGWAPCGCGGGGARGRRLQRWNGAARNASSSASIGAAERGRRGWQLQAATLDGDPARRDCGPGTIEAEHAGCSSGTRSRVTTQEMKALGARRRQGGGEVGGRRIAWCSGDNGGDWVFARGRKEGKNGRRGVLIMPEWGRARGGPGLRAPRGRATG